MTDTLPPCPECESTFTYEQGALLVCPMCAHEWEPEGPNAAGAPQITDAHGTPLADGDAVTIIKDLKVKGSSQVLKVGTKIKNIRLADGFGGHDIECKVNGAAMHLKSEFVRRS